MSRRAEESRSPFHQRATSPTRRTVSRRTYDTPSKHACQAVLGGRQQHRWRCAGHPDQTNISRLRCGGKPRLYGFRVDPEFYVVFWDPEHVIYPSLKRNT